MNYFELYPGDYLRDTTRLSLLEHGAYLRLLLAYYGEGVPFPDDLTELYVAAGAGNASEKAAVRKVADKYFPVAEDGLRRNKRADEVIALADERMEGSDERKANDAERKRRSRARRSAMFDALREVGQVPDFDATMDDLKTLVARHVTPDKCVTLGVTPSQKSRPVTRDGTATRPQTPYTNQEQKLPPSSSPARQPARSDDDDSPVPGEQDLPGWVPRSLWREFYRHRAVIRKPLSIPGQRQVVARLVELSEAGHDIAASLRQTMAAGLAIPVQPRDPDHDHANRGAGRKLSAVEQVEQAIRERRERESRGDDAPPAIGCG